ncbi:MAG: hypothetical protein QXS20_05830 [Candidatus Thorarchaeota archaeon]
MPLSGADERAVRRIMAGSRWVYPEDIAFYVASYPVACGPMILLPAL